MCVCMWCVYVYIYIYIVNVQNLNFPFCSDNLTMNVITASVCFYREVTAEQTNEKVFKK